MPDLGQPTITHDGLLPAFASPVDDAQRTFRHILHAMSHPGTVVAFEKGHLPPAPSPLMPTSAAVLLTLCDLDTPLWLDAAAQAEGAVRDHLKFHLGARLVCRPDECSFAVVTDALMAPPLAHFVQGTDAAPELSTTVVMQVDDLSETEDATPKAVLLQLTGPGIQSKTVVSVMGIDPGLLECLWANAAQFPRGVDVIFATQDRIMAVPRSVRVLAAGEG